MPALGSTSSSFLARPAPRLTAAKPSAIGSRSETAPADSALTVATGSPIRLAGSSSAAASPPWASTISWKTPNAQPSRNAAVASWWPCSGDSAASPSHSISPASASVTSVTSGHGPPAGVSFFRIEMASAVSGPLPMARPSGTSMSVRSATVGVPNSRPTRTRVSASSRARASSFMNAPRPCFTSSTRASMPSASFLDRIEAAMSGIDSTVPVTSRRP